MPEIGWIDRFVREVKPYVFVREEDSLLIVMPNRAYKLNPTAVAILGRVLDGESIVTLMGRHAQDEQKARQVSDFFCDVRAAVMDCLGEGEGRRAVELIPYTLPFNTLPVLSEVALTYRCNLRCVFCYAGCECRKGDRREMTTREVKRILWVIRHDARVPSTSFTGGEPTLRSDLAELIRAARETGLRVNLITNATLLDEKTVAVLKAAGLDSAQVSLEAPDASVHDSLTGEPGSFELTRRGIRCLQDAGIYVHTNTTLNRVNCGLAVRMPGFVKALGLKRFSMNLLIPCGRALDHREAWLSYADVGPIVDAVRRRAREEGVGFMWYSPTPYCLFNPVAHGLGGKACAACDGLLSVAPDGSVLPCSSFGEGVGNLLSEDFLTLWNSARARYFRSREYAPQGCRSCELFTLCGGACPLYWKAVGEAELIETAAGRGG